MVWVCGGLILCMGLYLYLIAPGRSRKSAWPRKMLSVYYAHRGLHGKDAPENTLKAFQLACEKGYGIELDVRLTRDGELVVHHDPFIPDSVTGEKQIIEQTLPQLRQYRIAGTEHCIPTFQEALNQIQGKAPLIVELKTAGKRNEELAQKAYSCLKAYSGLWCVESFDPRLIYWFRRHAPQALRGQLAYDPSLGGPPGSGILYWCGANLLTNFLSRPDFVAYCHETDRNFSFRLMRALFHPVTVAWTVRSQAACNHLREQYDLQIFEGFEP